MAVFWFGAVIFYLLVSGTFACGSLTHNTIGNRALTFYKNQQYASYGKNYPESFQNGCVFPDWGYNLFSDELHDAAEEAHWPPFLQAFAAHIFKNHPKPWNPATERVISFILGQMSHSVSDIVWHDLAEVRRLTGQGLIRAQAQIYFNGSFSPSHTEADVGGEFAIASETSTSWLKPQWFCPIDDLLAVYHKMNFTAVTQTSIEQGNAMLFAAAHLASISGKLLNPVTSLVAPFLQENLFSYFIGGIDDSSQWTAICWDNIVDWLENGPNNKICKVQPPLSGTPKTMPKASRGIVKKLLAHPKTSKALLYLRTFVEIKHSSEDRGSYFSFSKPVSEILEQFLADQLQVKDEKKQKLDSCVYPSDLKNVMTFKSNSSYSYLGHSMAHGDFDGDGTDEFVIGAPGYTPDFGREQSGAVWIVKGVPVVGQSELYLTPNMQNAVMLLGDERAARFGYSLTTVDLNRDGFADLVVSSPSSQSSNLMYKGKITIFYGSPSGITSNSPQTIIRFPDQNSEGAFTSMGTSLSSADFDDDNYLDLVIGSPHSCSLLGPCTAKDKTSHQKGSTAIFLSSKWTSRPEIDLAKANWIKEGKSAYNMFGSSTGSVKTPKGPLLVSSSPLESEAAPATGSLYTFNVTSGKVPSAKIFSSDRFAKFGTSFAQGNPYSTSTSPKDSVLVVGAPTTEISNFLSLPVYQGGNVQIFPSQILTGGDQKSQPMVQFTGDQAFGRFGWQNLMTDVNGDGIGDLIVSQPWADSQSGKIHVWFGGSRFPISRIPVAASSSHWCLHLPVVETQSRPHLGLTMKSFTFDKKSKSNLIAVAAPRMSDNADMAGAVYVINLSG